MGLSEQESELVEYLRKLSAETREKQGGFGLIGVVVGTADRIVAIIDRLAGEQTVHAYWIDGEDKNGKAYCYCSECSEDALYDSHGYREFSDRCPHCGAYMDGERRKESDDATD